MPEDNKAIEILNWLYDQSDHRNALYYTNEFARKLLAQGRIKDVISLLIKFSSAKINASEIANDEV